jgi:Ssp1 endopeptidase immunity protein Rap1a
MAFVACSPVSCQLPAPPLALFAAHPAPGRFHPPHACLRASRIAALAGELYGSLQPGFGHAGIRGTKIMRVYIIAASVALSVIGKASGTVVDTGADAQRSCELLVEGSFHDNGEARSAGACEGMLETAMSFSPNLPPDVRACPPAQGSVLESAKVLLRYLDQNPDRLEVPGLTLAIEAFRDSWPCQGDDAGPSGRSKAKKRAPKKSK